MTWLLFAVVPLIVLSVALFNVATWRRGDPKARIGRNVSILIPARNEEHHIAQALDSIPKTPAGVMIREILVYDDNSTDQTRSIVQRKMQKDARIRLLSGGPLPQDWVGKPHALSRLAEAASGDFLLFMDADVELKPEGLNRLLSLTLSPVLGRVVTAMPQQLTGSFFERLVLPLLPLTYLSWLPLRLVEFGKDPRKVAANGQLLLLRADDYRKLGGFEAVRNQIVEDVGFCRLAKKNGMKVVFADGTLIAQCRMYTGARETIEGFSKNLYEGVGGRLGTVAAMLLYVYAFLLPYFGLAMAMVSPRNMAAALLPAAIGSLANVTLQTILVTRYRQPPISLLLHPLSILAFVGIAINSFRWNARGNVIWSGRSYPSMEQRLSCESPGTGAVFRATPHKDPVK